MRKRRVLITGAAGQLGIALQNLNRPEWDVHPLTSAQMDVTNWPRVRDSIALIGPDLVIHAAAATNVDRCEREPEWAYGVNALGARNVAQAAALVHAELVYLSTNYVFDGTKREPYHEFDDAQPISVYGLSKLAGEMESSSATPRCFVVRTASIFAARSGNFVATMQRLMEAHERISVVNDQFSNPTYAGDLAAAIAELLSKASYGTYHITNSGIASWHEWASEIQRIIGAKCEVEPITASEYKRDARPPANGTMLSMALPQLGITLPSWRDALERCLRQWPA